MTGLMEAGKKSFVGVDLGQSHDPTAAAVIERVETKGAWDAEAFAHRRLGTLWLRHLERVPLGTPYPEVVDRVTDVTQQVALGGKSELLVDATGVGRPVVDLLRRQRLMASLTPVVVTSGMGVSHADGFTRVPKRDLIVGLQVALQSGALRIAAGVPGLRALMEEMAGMRVAISAAGNEQFGARRAGGHDDLVFAVALACWGARRAYPREMNGDGGVWAVRPEF